MKYNKGRNGEIETLNMRIHIFTELRDVVEDNGPHMLLCFPYVGLFGDLKN
jgi:hypothetical protein